MLRFKLNVRDITSIFSRLHPEMPITRQVCSDLPFDNRKDLHQTARKDFGKKMFQLTTDHLHNLAHGPDFEARLMSEISIIPIKFVFKKAIERQPEFSYLLEKISTMHNIHGISDEYGALNLPLQYLREYENHMKEAIDNGFSLNYSVLVAESEENINFARTIMDDFIRHAHKIHLPQAILEKPTTYLASVYSLSVGIGALKGWILREASPPKVEVELFEKLRDGRNFMAHGDIFRRMNNINLTDVQEDILIEHLDHCAVLNGDRYFRSNCLLVP